jgi:hypothetical protein
MRPVGRPMKKLFPLTACLVGLLISSRAYAQTTAMAKDGEATLATAARIDAAVQEPQNPKKTSPWLVLPLLSTNPKMDTSGGVLGAYLHHFDPQSQVSMFGLMFEYSTSDSKVGGVFARTSFGADHHRLEGVAGFGNIKNEYEDYLGTGETVGTTDNLLAVAARYLYRIKDSNWFIGGQTLFANYEVTGTTPYSNQVLDLLGLAGVNTGGIGLAMMHDSRDNQDMPEKGWYFALNNVADRKWLGADEDYGTYRFDFKWFREHGGGHIFAVRQYNELTANAPASAQTTVHLRGYKVQQYLGAYMSSAEAEERIRFSKRWGATIFGGIAGLYGGPKSVVNSNGIYPSYGAGLHFVVKPEDNMLLNLEYAHGDLNNYGIYLKFGYSW